MTGRLFSTGEETLIDLYVANGVGSDKLTCGEFIAFASELRGETIEVDETTQRLFKIVDDVRLQLTNIRKRGNLPKLKGGHGPAVGSGGGHGRGR